MKISMNAFLMAGVLASLAGASAFAEADSAECAPGSAVICTIATAASSSTYYLLSTTVQSYVTSEYIGKDGSSYEVDPVKAKAALAKLQAKAEMLKAAGVCKAIINNVE